LEYFLQISCILELQLEKTESPLFDTIYYVLQKDIICSVSKLIIDIPLGLQTASQILFILLICVKI